MMSHFEGGQTEDIPSYLEEGQGKPFSSIQALNYGGGGLVANCV